MSDAKAKELNPQDRPDELCDSVAIRWVPDYESLYAVTDDGRVYSYHRSTPREMTICDHSSGYGQVCLSRGDGGVSKLVHRLVLKAFTGPCPEGMESRHLDGDKMNNQIDNLEWATHQQNMKDNQKHGVVARGEKLRSRLTENDVREIVRMIESGEFRQREIAKEFDVCQGTIAQIACGNNWTHITGGPVKSATERWQWRKRDINGRFK